MSPAAPSVVALVATALAVIGCIQALAGYAAVRRFRGTIPPAGARPAISVLKPLHGSEPLLEEALASFCAQDYPEVQIIFGVQDAHDPAIAVVDRLRERFAEADIELVVDPTMHGPNHKVANLINMFPWARHDVLVMSDSDMHAPPDYLARVVDALCVPGTGLVTTLYTGKPARRGLAGLLGSAYITQSFAAGALMARALGRQDCMGATMALTRETLMRVGGLPSLSPYVADDAVLGMKIRALGQNVALAACVPATTVGERRLAALFRHELRWARTIRAVAPFGFAASMLQYPGFWALAAVPLSGFAPWSMGVWAGAIGARALLGRLVEREMGSAPTPAWLPALRDVLSMAVLVAAYMGDEVAWRGHKLSTGHKNFTAGRPLVPRRG